MDFTLCLTHACNLRCAYCYAGEKSDRRMSWPVAQRSVDFCLEHAVNRARLLGRPAEAQIGFFGGEPLLEWDLLQRTTAYAMSEAERLGVTLRRTVTTNMSLLDEARAEWLRTREFHVGLSLDGNATMHDTLRRFPDGQGSHAACAPALRFYRGADAGAEVIVVIDPRNVEHLAASVEWLVSEDVRHISLNPNFYRAWPKLALAAWQEACERIGDLYIERFRRASPVRINVIDGKIRTHLKEGYAACDRCGFGEHEIAIAASGNIYPCERIVADDACNADLCLGSVFSGFDPERRARVLAERGNNLGECEACDLRARCMNWCSCINYATTGTTNRVSGIVCHHEKMVIAVADRVGSTLYAESNPAFLSRFYG
jgi:uncharacterized protein